MPGNAGILQGNLGAGEGRGSLSMRVHACVSLPSHLVVGPNAVRSHHTLPAASITRTQGVALSTILVFTLMKSPTGNHALPACGTLNSY